jgi:hypothetical protein
MRNTKAVLLAVILAVTACRSYAANPAGVSSNAENQREIVSLRDFVEEKFKAVDKATTLMQENIDTRMEANNQWRDESKQRTALMVTREEFMQTNARVAEDIRYLRESKATLEGKASQSSVFIGYLISAIAILISLMSMVIKSGCRIEPSKRT